MNLFYFILFGRNLVYYVKVEYVSSKIVCHNNVQLIRLIHVILWWLKTTILLN